jgi:hypothetical protein
LKIIFASAGFKTLLKHVFGTIKKTKPTRLLAKVANLKKCFNNLPE